MVHSLTRRAAPRATLLPSSFRYGRQRATELYPTQYATARPTTASLAPSMGKASSSARAWSPAQSAMGRATVVPGPRPQRCKGATATSGVKPHVAVGDRRVLLRKICERRWANAGYRAVRLLILPATGTTAAAQLISRGYSLSTRGISQGLWERFAEYCRLIALRAPPADQTTVCSYIRSLFKNNTVRGSSLRPYVAAIATRHRQNGIQSHTDHPLAVATRRGYRIQGVRRAIGAPIRLASLSSSVAALALRRAIVAPPSLADTTAMAVTALRE